MITLYDCATAPEPAAPRNRHIEFDALMAIAEAMRTPRGNAPRGADAVARWRGRDPRSRYPAPA